MHGPAAILPLEINSLTHEIDGRRLLDDIAVTLRPGQRTIVLGPNGAGKTLLLRLCHGLLKPSAGTIRWACGDAALARRRQAMVFQQPVLLRRSVLANVVYALSLRRVPRAERRSLAEMALDRTGLLALADRPARVLSGGERQRLALARAWALQPEILFLDEPTANLDPAATLAVEQAIEAVHVAGTKIVMTTHDLGQARRLADEVLFLFQGRLLEHGPAAAFFREPRSAEAKAFLKGELIW